MTVCLKPLLLLSINASLGSSCCLCSALGCYFYSRSYVNPPSHNTFQFVHRPFKDLNLSPNQICTPIITWTCLWTIRSNLQHFGSCWITQQAIQSMKNTLDCEKPYRKWHQSTMDHVKPRGNELLVHHGPHGPHQHHWCRGPPCAAQSGLHSCVDYMHGGPCGCLGFMPGPSHTTIGLRLPEGHATMPWPSFLHSFAIYTPFEPVLRLIGLHSSLRISLWAPCGLNLEVYFLTISISTPYSISSWL